VPDGHVGPLGEGVRKILGEEGGAVLTPREAGADARRRTVAPQVHGDHPVAAPGELRAGQCPYLAEETDTYLATGRVSAPPR
jgi:hypothetical protein